MKKFVIVQKSNLTILASYEAEDSKLGTGEFGGPWNDSNAVMHLEVPERLKDSPQADLRVVHEMGIIAINFVPCHCDEGKPVFKEVFDKNGHLITDSKGHPFYAQLFEKQEITGMVYNVKLVGE